MVIVTMTENLTIEELLNRDLKEHFDALFSFFLFIILKCDKIKLNKRNTRNLFSFTYNTID